MSRLHARLSTLALIALALSMPMATTHAEDIHLAWDPSTDADVTGYKLFYGTSPGVYANVIDVGNVTDYVVTGLSSCTRYYFAAKAYDVAGNLSGGFSNEVRGLPNLTVASVSPLQAERGQALTATITGSSFDQGATVIFSDRINVYSTTYVSCSKLRATISLSSDATQAPQEVWVVNPDGSYGSLPSAFRVLPMTVPFVTSISPAPGSRGVPVTARPSVSFNEVINPLTIKPTTVILLRPDGSAVPQAPGYPALDVSGRIASIVPAANLEYGTTYRLQVVGGFVGVRDAQGTPLTNTFTYGGFLTVEGLSSEAPEVVETTPAPGAADVTIDVGPTVTFNEDMDPATLTADTVQVLGPGGAVPQAAPPQLDFSRRVATLTLASTLEYGTTYSLHVEGGADGVLAADGTPLSSSYTQSPGFTTPSGPDTDPPVVGFTDPVDGTESVPVDGVITVLFSEPMDVSSLSPATVQILDARDEPVFQEEGSPATGDGGRIATIVPERRLGYGARYRVVVRGGPDGVKDAHGNPMEEDYSQALGLMTVTDSDGAAPVVVSATPMDAEVGVPRDAHPTIMFSEPMDPRTITSDSVRLLDAQHRPVPQADGSPRLEGSGTIVTVVPAQPLASGETYLLEVLSGDGGVYDEEGAPMNGRFIQTTGFTVIHEDTEGPMVIWSDPQDMDRRVDRQKRPVIYVNEAVDAATVTPLTVMLVGPDGAVIQQDELSPEVDESGTILRIHPKDFLDPHTIYRIQVVGGPEGVRDIMGNPMQSTFSMEHGFQTR